MAASTHIVMPIFPDVAHLDFTGPHMFFSRMPGVRITVASVGGVGIAAEGMSFGGLAAVEEVEGCDLICIPGGAGVGDAMADPVYLEAVRRLAGGARYVTSVCTGSLILGAAGLLRGRRAACHWAWRDMLTLFGAIPDEGRVVRDGNVITGGGVTAGIDFSLVVIAELCGDAVAQAIQLGLEYAPAPPFAAGRPEIAPESVLAAVRAGMAGSLPGRRAAIERAAAQLKEELLF